MNCLPESIQERIESLTYGKPVEQLASAAEKLTALYRMGAGVINPLTTYDAHLAYLACRMPATFAALVAVFSQLAQRVPNYTPTSLLDLGAGPGTAYIAAQAVFGTITSAHLVERSTQFVEIGKKLIPDAQVT